MAAARDLEEDGAPDGRTEGRGDAWTDAWSRAHAAGMLAGCGVAALVGRAWPLSLAALISIAWLLALGRGRFTPAGAFGAANVVTALRCALTLALGLLAWDVPGVFLAAGVGVVFFVDGIDGWIARREGTASRFGGTFDLETDALLVLLATVQLWQRGRLGVWILAPGVLRYLYVLALACVPPAAGHVQRSRLGRVAFFLLIVGLAAAFTLPDATGTAMAGAGTVAVGLSFARSFAWSYRLWPRR